MCPSKQELAVTSVQAELVCGIGTSSNLCAVVHSMATGETAVPAALAHSRVVCCSPICKLDLGDGKTCIGVPHQFQIIQSFHTLHDHHFKLLGTGNM